MVDELTKIDRPLFQTPIVKKVREVSKRPQEGRTTRDTYSESDEPALLNEAERLKMGKSKKENGPHEEKALEREDVDAKTHTDEEGEDGDNIKHVNVVV